MNVAKCLKTSFLQNTSGLLLFRLLLKILTGKKHRQIKRLQKVGIHGYLRRRYIKSTLYKRFLNWNKIFKKNKAFTDKTPFFVIGSFRTHHSVCLSTSFWYGSFVWEWWGVFNLIAFNHWKRFSFSRKSVSKLKYWNRSKFPRLSHKNMLISQMEMPILKIPSTVSSRKMPFLPQASSEQAEAQRCLSIAMRDCTSSAKRLPPKTANEKKFLSIESSTGKSRP